jgi:hypothetical protein
MPDSLLLDRWAIRRPLGERPVEGGVKLGFLENQAIAVKGKEASDICEFLFMPALTVAAARIGSTRG